jgi:hypothetical protein
MRGKPETGEINPTHQTRTRTGGGTRSEEAIRKGSRELAKYGRKLCRYNFAFGTTWQGKPYSVKQVAPVIKEDARGIVVITVYTFYF